MSNGILNFNEAVCVCGRHVKGRDAGSKTRGSKQMRWFECFGRNGCGHSWKEEVPPVSSPTAPSNGHSNGNGHGPVTACCPNCKHEFEVTHG